MLRLCLRSLVILVAISILCATDACARVAVAGPPVSHPMILNPDHFEHYIRTFNRNDQELYPGYIDNAHAWAFLKNNIPLLDCPDQSFEQIYYFRWWAYRKHIKKTPVGFIITEFLPKVRWSGPYNAMDCAAGHLIYEGRWLHNRTYMNDYAHFWLSGQGLTYQYSSWLANALWGNYLVTGDKQRITEQLPGLVKNFNGWVQRQGTPSGLFWQADVRDGMEMSAGGSGFRPSINSYMYGDALAISRIARLADAPRLAEQFGDKARAIRQHTLRDLWNQRADFFETRKFANRQKHTPGPFCGVREEIGFTPWYFNLPPDRPPYAAAWKQLMDSKGFYAPYGLTTCEQRSRKFHIRYTGHECQWDGPSWPFSTSITLTAMANLLDNYPNQHVVTKADYFKQLCIFVKSQHLTKPDGQTVPWIDEDLDPYTGTWIAHKLLLDRHAKPYLRGKEYNQSTFCDLVITGLIGLRPHAGDTVEVKPLIPPGQWTYFCLDNVLYHGRILTIVYDRTGEHYRLGKGLRVFADGELIARRADLGYLEATLPPEQ